MKKLVRISLLAMLLLTFFCGARAGEGDVVGNPFREVSFVDTDGETVTVSALAAEKPLTVLHFFASWYPRGAGDLRLLEEALRQRDGQIAVAALSADADDDMETVRAYREKLGLSFPMGCADQELTDNLYMIHYPLTLFIDRGGTVRASFQRCFRSAGELDTVLDYLLDEASGQEPAAAYSAYVQDQDFNPVPGVTVAFEAEGGTATAVTGEDGIACLPLGPLAAYTVRIAAVPDGYAYEPDMTITSGPDYSYVILEIVGPKADMPEPEAGPDAAAAAMDGPFTLENIRSYVVGVDQPVRLADGTARPAVNFDNAATTPALLPVMAEVNRQLMMYGSIGRGAAQKSDHSTAVYNAARDKVLRFVSADPGKYTCVFVGNTTDGLNKLASALIAGKDDVVLATRLEHHANDLSWRERCRVIYAEVDAQGRIQYDEIERLLKENTVNYVAVTAASNVTGYVTDVHRVAALAHRYGAKIIVDGAQIVAHRAFSMAGETPEEDIDFFVFSAHKMYSPYGGGAIVGLTEVLDAHMPAFYGGGTIRIVGDDWQEYRSAPESYEAGSPNYPGVVGMGKAIDILLEVGFDRIREHEEALNRRLIDGLKRFDHVILYGDTENIGDRVGVVAFNFSNVNSYLLAKRLANIGGVATRRGAFCANPYVWRLMGIPDSELEDFLDCGDMNTPGMIRVSFGIYNTVEEVDEFLRVLPAAIEAALNDSNTQERVVPAY